LEFDAAAWMDTLCHVAARGRGPLHMPEDRARSKGAKKTFSLSA
jgi:hypothetical protein